MVSSAASIAPPPTKPTTMYFDKWSVVPAGKMRLSTRPNPTNPRKTKRGIKPVRNAEVGIGFSFLPIFGDGYLAMTFHIESNIVELTILYSLFR